MTVLVSPHLASVSRFLVIESGRELVTPLGSKHRLYFITIKEIQRTVVLLERNGLTVSGGHHFRGRTFHEQEYKGNTRRSGHRS